MGRKLRIVAIFAGVGFVIACGLLGYSCVCYYFHVFPNSDVFILLCPSSIMAMALEGDPRISSVIFVWTLIGLSNAVLYAAVGTIISLFEPKDKPMS
jgi:hypothetical protein